MHPAPVIANAPNTHQAVLFAIAGGFLLVLGLSYQEVYASGPGQPPRVTLSSATASLLLFALLYGLGRTALFHAASFYHRRSHHRAR